MTTLSSALTHRPSILLKFSIFLGAALLLAAFALPAPASAASRDALYWNNHTVIGNVPSSYNRYNAEYQNDAYYNQYYYNNTSRYNPYQDYDYTEDYRRVRDCTSYDYYGNCMYNNNYDYDYYDYNDEYNEDYRYNDDYYNHDFRNNRYDYNRHYRRQNVVQNGDTLRKTVNLGGSFTVSLPGDSARKYRWTPSFDDNGLRISSHNYDGDWERFSIRANRRGTFRVTFRYGRGGTAPLQTISYQVYVR